MATDEPRLTEEEERLLRHEAFISKAIALRRKTDAEDISPSFLRLVESTGFTAVITVVLSSILAPLVVTSIQNNRARSDQALTEYKQYLERQQETVNNGYVLIAKTVSASQDLINITKPEFQLESSADPQVLKTQKTGITEKFNSTLETWQVEEDKVGLLMSYYHYGQPDVLPAWRTTQRSVDEFIKCARDRYREYRNDPEVVNKPDNCQPKKDAIRTAIDKLAKNIESSRRYQWQQLEVPAPASTSTSRPPVSAASPPNSQ
jgi:hypothetical protein